MNKKLPAASEIFSQLEGTWQGEGHGGYPTIIPFDYREELVFTRRDESTLSYNQRTEKRMDDQSAFTTSHWESGFIRVLEKEQLELLNAQSGGRGEVLTGTIERRDAIIRLCFESKILTNDLRVLSSTRIFELEGDYLRYEMSMSTTKVHQLTRHLSITLERVYE